MFKSVKATGIAVFRFLFSIVLLMEVLQLYKFRHVIYDKVSFVSVGELDVQYLFYFWFVTIFLLTVGLFTKTATIINYIFSVIVFSSSAKFEYHVFYTYISISFLLMFMPVSKRLSLDSLLYKLKYGKLQIMPEEENVLRANYAVPVLIGIGLVYFDSTLYKLTSPMWLKGLGLWLPASLPMATWQDTSFLLNSKKIMLASAYLVMIFEFLFVFFLWQKRFRIPLLLIGIPLHIGILLFFPIPWFALTVVVVYVLMVPVSWWSYIHRLLSYSKPKYTVVYNVNDIGFVRLAIIAKHFDWVRPTNFIASTDNKDIRLIDGFSKDQNGYEALLTMSKAYVFTYPLGLLFGVAPMHKAGNFLIQFLLNRLRGGQYEIVNEKAIWKPGRKLFWITIVALFIIGQFMVSWFSPTTQHILTTAGIPSETLNKAISISYRHSAHFFKKYLGVTMHPVFVDAHFRGYNHILRVDFHDTDGKVISVPMLDKYGLTDSYISGTTWRNYTFDVTGTKLDKSKYEEGVAPYLKFFLNQNPNISKNGKFLFYVKQVDIPTQWEENYLRSQLHKPWAEAGVYIPTKVAGDFVWSQTMDSIFKQEALKK